MKLIVGLGNPGKKYEKTRHNVGFMVLDELAKSENTNFLFSTKFKGEIARIHNEKVILLKPHTFMNSSGLSVLIVKQFFNIDNEDILIVHDDLDLNCGKIRFRQKGGSGGHKGLKSIMSCINAENFHRLKIGISKDEVIPVENYVLGKFSKLQIKCINDAVITSLNGIDSWISSDILYVMNKYN